MMAKSGRISSAKLSGFVEGIESMVKKVVFAKSSMLESSSSLMEAESSLFSVGT
jgi:hypothetical protein